MENYRIAFDEMPWETSTRGARYKVCKLGSRQLRLLEFGRDLNHPDWCVTGHIGYVLDGEMEVEFENQTMIFRKGDGLYFPAGEQDKHRPKAISEKVRMIFVEDI